MMKTTIVAIIAITTLAVVAMCVGFNGVFLGIALSAISGLGGYEIKKKNDPPKQS